MDKQVREKNRRVHFLACVLVTGFAGVVGCGGGAKKFPVAHVSGRVVCEGKPVPHVMVYFEPLMTSKSAITGKQGIGICDEQGEFVVSTYSERDGAVVGRHRVRVGRPLSELHAGFSCDCVLDSEKDLMEVDVVQGRENIFELVLPKATNEQKAQAAKIAEQELRELQD